MKNYKNGFTLIEMVISIFLIAIVIGIVLLLMSSNMNVVNKANEIMIANALSQYSIEEVKNFEFPPVYSDRWGEQKPEEYGKIVDEKEDENSIDIGNGTDFTPPEFQDRFKIERYVIGYDNLGNPIEWGNPVNYADYDKAMGLRVIVYVLRKKGNTVLSRREIYISRNGLF
ncbi:MAG TPA: prepilin-type N-terminal cleavage/methylation domain-containing protein [Candidatus Ratteibacteria bacterium]|nr:prepilin-type N-terminal cleavage/methylation domain-containing protein [Candidatus Ratteibacteria bacterium]